MTRIGKVYLVGAGPGDPGLITRRGFDLLHQADVLVVDALVNPSLFVNARAQIIFVGKRGSKGRAHASHRIQQQQIHRVLIAHARKGHKVVRLKGGDPLVFGRGSEEMEALRKAHISFEVVPGVTSAIAAPAYAGIPITDRRWSSQVTFLTGHESANRESVFGRVNWTKLHPEQTLVILMGVTRWPFIQEQLLKSGWPASKPVVAIESGATVSQRVILATLKSSRREFKVKKLSAPAVIVVGDVGNLAKRLSWVDREKPLLGKRVVVTRSEHQASSLSTLLIDKGAEVILCPAIQIKPIQDDKHLLDFYERFKAGKEKFDLVVFLSANAVWAFANGIAHDSLMIKKSKIFSVGKATSQAVRDEGWSVYKEAEDSRAQGVLKIMGAVKNKRILIPRVEGGPMGFVYELMGKGARIKQITVYRNEPCPPPPDSLKEQILAHAHAVTFTSASCVNRFFEFFKANEIKRLFRRTVAVSIGPTTSQALRQKQVKNVIVAKEASLPSLIQALCRYLG